MIPPKRKAGQSARHKFRTIMLWLLVVAVVGIALDIGLYYTSFRTSHPWLLMAIIGLIIVTFKVADRHSDKVDRTWGNGARGEERTGHLLEPLEAADWVVLHDVDTDRGNIDHIAVGPTGIFTIETKSHQGKISYDGRQLLRNNRPLEKNILNQAIAESMAVKEHLKIHLQADYYVTAVVCFTRGFVQVRGGKAGQVHVVPGKWLVETLTRDKPRYSTLEVSQIGQALSVMGASTAAGRRA